MNFIPYGRQSIDRSDIEAVEKTLLSDFLTTGPEIEAFEREMAAYCGAGYAVAVSSGTAALHLASLALLEPGSTVITTPNSFVATSNALLYAGARPLFADIGRDGNIDLDLCEKLLRENPEIRVLYAVHFSGNPVDQERLAGIREKYAVTVLEDCAHSLGASDGDIRAGSCQNSDVSIFSFHPVKNMTTGEGGMVTTNDPEIAEKIRLLRNHGIVKTPEMKPWEYEMRELGFNYRITDLQCSLGRSQLKKLDSFTGRRRELARRYDDAFSGHPYIRPLYRYDGRSSYHLYVVLVDFQKIGIKREALFGEMKKRGIGLQVHYIPINKQPYYRKLGYGGEYTPVMDDYYRQCVSLPLYPALRNDEQEYVIRSLMEVLNG
ncbi:UDP-4-amino-4,6-dideoxy-N-acetyl-beta-L-altrosamine transaminase [Hydrogenimonas sp. SS33]|uniref:UDP-4-amino-4, 6-dideoxy-N-acetyl-beta-L-altrosamine transaminase n=1 Tax=Hydrogenimonas leucolamina TaxID=2954236 RepID=UPI00336BB111